MSKHSKSTVDTTVTRHLAGGPMTAQIAHRITEYVFANFESAHKYASMLVNPLNGIQDWARDVPNWSPSFLEAATNEILLKYPELPAELKVNAYHQCHAYGIPPKQSKTIAKELITPLKINEFVHSVYKRVAEEAQRLCRAKSASSHSTHMDRSIIAHFVVITLSSLVPSSVYVAYFDNLAEDDFNAAVNTPMTPVNRFDYASPVIVAPVPEVFTPIFTPIPVQVTADEEESVEAAEEPVEEVEEVEEAVEDVEEVEEATEESVQEVAEEPVEEVVDDEPVQEVADEAVQEPVEEVVDEPVEEVVDEPVEEVADDEAVQEPVEEVAEVKEDVIEEPVHIVILPIGVPSTVGTPVSVTPVVTPKNSKPSSVKSHQSHQSHQSVQSNKSVSTVIPLPVMGPPSIPSSVKGSIKSTQGSVQGSVHSCVQAPRDLAKQEKIRSILESRGNLADACRQFLPTEVDAASQRSTRSEASITRTYRKVQQQQASAKASLQNTPQKQ